jgi:hypothetical protein
MAGKNKILSKLTVLSALAAACLALSGCFEIETYTTYVPIDFRSYAATSGSSVQATRADGSFVPVGQTVLPDSSSFGVFAFYQEGVIGSGTPALWSAGGWKPEYMFNQQVDFDGTNYSYTPLRYWPANDENRISFWAYYPYSAYVSGNTGDLKLFESDGTTPYSKTSVGLPKVSYTVSMDPAQQRDLLFDSFSNTDKTFDNCAPTPGTVNLNFRHALALVEFQIIEGTGAVINAMDISNLYWNGVCTDVTNLTWASQGGLDDFSISDVTVESSTVCRLLMIPQDLTVSNPVLTINYDITFDSSDPNHPEDIVFKGNSGSAALTSAKNEDGLGSAGITAWRSGKHYIYKIRAGFDRIEFEEVVESSDDWIMGNDNISVPQP